MGLDAVAWVNFPSGGHASETAEPQQDSGPTGCHWVSRAAAVWAPSNPLKAKDGAGRCGLGEFSIRWARIRNGRTPAGCRPNGLPLGQQSRCRLGTFEPAKSKGGWMGLDARIRNGRTTKVGGRGWTLSPWVQLPAKAKVGGRGWTLSPWVQLPALLHFICEGCFPLATMQDECSLKAKLWLCPSRSPPPRA